MLYLFAKKAENLLITLLGVKAGMEKMNTTEKGDRLEDQVFAVFGTQISEDNFVFKRDCCKIHKKKGYYSKDREKEIIFDVSIEITFPGQKDYSILILIECKNYNHSVPVDDTEEFFAKIQQVSGANIKGIVVSTNSFQEGAFKFSKSKGIGLLRYFDKDNLEWVLTRSPSSIVSTSHSMTEWSSAYNGLRNQDYKSRYFDWYGYVCETYTISSNHFFSSLIRNGIDKNLAESLAEVEQGLATKQLSVPYREIHEIENICSSMLDEVGYQEGAAPLDALCSFLSERNNLMVERNVNLAKGVLGEITFSPNVIRIDDSQAASIPRVRFTLAHEIGHLLLGHSEYMDHESCHDEDIEIESPVTIGFKDVSRMEWQANYFASCLLLPSKQFTRQFLIEAVLNDLSDKGYGLLYVDQQRCNIDTYHKVTTPLMNRFEVSRSVVKLRLKKLGFLNEPENAPNVK